MSSDNRDNELIACHLLTYQELIPQYLRDKRFSELAALAEFANNDAPLSLIHHDNAKYRTLRAQITEYRIKGWNRLDPGVLRRLAGLSDPEPPTEH